MNTEATYEAVKPVNTRFWTHLDELGCACCGDLTAGLNQYGTTHDGRMYWSSPLCSVDCHDRFYQLGAWTEPEPYEQKPQPVHITVIVDSRTAGDPEALRRLMANAAECVSVSDKHRLQMYRVCDPDNPIVMANVRVELKG